MQLTDRRHVTIQLRLLVWGKKRLFSLSRSRKFLRFCHPSPKCVPALKRRKINFGQVRFSFLLFFLFLNNNGFVAAVFPHIKYTLWITLIAQIPFAYSSRMHWFHATLQRAKCCETRGSIYWPQKRMNEQLLNRQRRF